MFNRLKNIISPAVQTVSAGVADNPNQALPERPDPAESVAHKEQGDTHLRNGNLEEAKACYQRAIALDPNYAKAHSNLGYILKEQGNFEDAERCFKTALSIAPKIADTHYMLGTVFQSQGKTEDAIRHFRKALESDPDHEFAYRDLCYALFQQGRIEDAKDVISKAIAHNQSIADYHYYLGNLYAHTKEFDKAAASYRAALSIQPAFAGAHFNFGITLQGQGNLGDAIASYRNAITLNPDFADAHYNLGVVFLKEQRLPSEAEACFRRVVEINPGFADAHYNLGVALNDLGFFEKALVSFRRALEIKPDYADAYFSLGSTLKELGKFAEAETSYGRALELEPDNAIFRVAQMFTIPNAPQTVTDAVAVPGTLDRSLKQLSDLMLASPDQREQFSDALGLQTIFYLAYRDGNHVSLLSRFGDLMACGSLHTQLKPIPKREKLRLVVVSSHFHRHSVWDVIIRGILANLDRTRFEVVLYSLGWVEDEETKLAKSLADVWRDSRTIASLNGWLDAMAADQPDAIFYPEIGMDHLTLRLASRRLAPLQFASWGHPITTGLPMIDLYFSGELLEPPEADAHYRERLVRLPGTGCCTAPIELEPEDMHQLAADLARRPGARFVVAQRVFKFDPANDALFASIAAAVGECTFILISDIALSGAMEQLIARLNRAFFERNLDPNKHLLIIPWVSLEKFYALLDLCDISLECPSFSGYTTAWQAVQRGLPVVTLEGKFMRQRLGAGLLRKIGMTDTIAASVEDYVAIAVWLAAECRDPVRRNARRLAIRTAAHLADNDVSVIRAFERNIIEALADRNGFFNSKPPSGAPLSPHPQVKHVMNPMTGQAWKMLDADMHLHTLDPNYAPTGLLEMVKPAPKRVLDLGCFCGGSGRWLKQRFPGCEVVGIEMLDKAAAIAAKTYEHVIAGAFEQVDFEEAGLKHGSFDAIIAADVLEHLFNPWQALQRLKPILAQNGAIYISLPNIRNLNILSALASGEWRYEGAGILDVTHIRFFTLAQASEMLTQTGWIIDETRLNPDPRLAHLFEGKNLEEITTISKGNLKLENLKSIDVMELMALQFFIRAKLAPIN